MHVVGDDLYDVALFDLVQRSHDYEQHADNLRQIPAGGLNYLGIAICGSGRQVNSLSGSLGLLRWFKGKASRRIYLKRRNRPNTPMPPNSMPTINPPAKDQMGKPGISTAWAGLAGL